MRIEQTPRRPPYLNQRDQLRMLAMVALLMFMVFAIRVAARPSSWYWLTGVPRQNSEEVPNREIDFHVEGETTRPLRPDEFFATVDGEEPMADEPPADNAAARQAHDDAAPSGETPPGEAQEASAESANSQPTDQQDENQDIATTSAGLPEINPEMFSEVKDNTLGVRQQEAGLHNILLARAAKTPPAQLAAAARDDVSFTVLMLEPDRFRGELLTVRGRVKKVVELPVAANRFDVTKMYEAWIFTRDSGINPYRFVFTEPPQGLSLGDIRGDVDVSATGYFFKRYGYATEQGMHVAPLLLGRELLRVEPRQVIPLDTSFTNYVIVGVLAGLVVLVIVLWRINRTDRTFYQNKLRPLAAPPDTSLAPLQGRADESSRELLGRLQQQASADAAAPAEATTTPEERPNEGNSMV